uniref:Ribonuclease P/MRP 40 subunit n=1 Tax=Astyanax mexicanus TaxID=7994 RepID=A0A8B9J3P8_ASTMX
IECLYPTRLSYVLVLRSGLGNAFLIPYKIHLTLIQGCNIKLQYYIKKSVTLETDCARLCVWFNVILFNLTLSNVFFVSGQLILSLDKDTYEQLGLEGRPSQYSHRKTVRHIVTVDLKSLVLGTKKYQRVLLCLKERVPLKTDFLFTAAGGAVSLLDLLSKQLYEECRPALHCRTLQDLLCPSLIPSDLKGESGSVTPTQFLEWLGAVSLSISW